MRKTFPIYVLAVFLSLPSVATTPEEVEQALGTKNALFRAPEALLKKKEGELRKLQRKNPVTHIRNVRERRKARKAQEQALREALQRVQLEYALRQQQSIAQCMDTVIGEDADLVRKLGATPSNLMGQIAKIPMHAREGRFKLASRLFTGEYSVLECVQFAQVVDRELSQMMVWKGLPEELINQNPHVYAEPDIRMGFIIDLVSLPQFEDSSVARREITFRHICQLCPHHRELIPLMGSESDLDFLWGLLTKKLPPMKHRIPAFSAAVKQTIAEAVAGSTVHMALQNAFDEVSAAERAEIQAARGVHLLPEEPGQ